MDDLLYLLVFLFFFVILPMMQRMRKQGQTPQPSRRPQRSGGRDTPSVPPSYDEDPSYDEEARRSSSSPQQRAEQRTAEDVLPDDLWQILTGERRPSPRAESDPEHEAETEPEPFESDYEPAYTQDGGTERERDEDIRGWGDVSAETPVPWEPEPAPQPIPVPVPLPRPVRLPQHARSTPVAPRRAPGRTPRSGRQAYALPRTERPLDISLNLDSRDDLRRAMILREVLGPPKGLQ